MSQNPFASNGHHIARRTLLSGLGAMAAGRALAQSPTSVKFSCDFRVYGGTAPFFYGLDTGLFKAQGINASVDGSLGSGDAITRVASGAYDFGCADVSTLVEFTSRNPEAAPKLVMPIYDRFPACIVSLQPKPVTSIKGLEGITLGVSTSDAGSRILPGAVAAARRGYQKDQDGHARPASARFDADPPSGRCGDWLRLHGAVQPDRQRHPQGRRAPRLLFRQRFQLLRPGADRGAAPCGVEPALVRGMAIAVAQSWLATAKNPNAAIASITKRDALASAAVETDRLNWVLDRLVLTPNVRANGIGAMDMKRLNDGIKIVAEGFQLPAPIPGDQVFDGRFIPPADIRHVG